MKRMMYFHLSWKKLWTTYTYLSWHTINFIKDKDSHCVTSYVTNNNLEKVSNGIHHFWTRTLLRSLKRPIRRMKKVDFSLIESTTYNPVVSVNFPLARTPDRLVRRTDEKNYFSK